MPPKRSTRSAATGGLQFSDENQPSTPNGQKPKQPTGVRQPRQPIPPSSTPDTPRKRKPAKAARHDGLTTTFYTREKIATLVHKRLSLPFAIDDWQAELILRILEGHDSIFIAGTGYGKSIVFEGLAAMSPGKTIIVVCPLKTLEKDQVS